MPPLTRSALRKLLAEEEAVPEQDYFADDQLSPSSIPDSSVTFSVLPWDVTHTWKRYPLEKQHIDEKLARKPGRLFGVGKISQWIGRVQASKKSCDSDTPLPHTETESERDYTLQRPTQRPLQFRVNKLSSTETARSGSSPDPDFIERSAGDRADRTDYPKSKRPLEQGQALKRKRNAPSVNEDISQVSKRQKVYESKDYRLKTETSDVHVHTRSRTKVEKKRQMRREKLYSRKKRGNFSWQMPGSTAPLEIPDGFAENAPPTPPQPRFMDIFLVVK